MPRNLAEEAAHVAAAGAVPLTESPSMVTDEPDKADEDPPAYQRGFVIVPEDQHFRGPMNLHPYTRPLTIADLESVVALENAAFPNPEERATREKVSALHQSHSWDCLRDNLLVSAGH